jgi:hypothetical protein
VNVVNLAVAHPVFNAVAVKTVYAAPAVEAPVVEARVEKQVFVPVTETVQTRRVVQVEQVAVTPVVAVANAHAYHHNNVAVVALANAHHHNNVVAVVNANARHHNNVAVVAAGHRGGTNVAVTVNAGSGRGGLFARVGTAGRAKQKVTVRVRG